MPPAKSTAQTPKPKGQEGFTLIELIVVVTIIGILAGIAVAQVKNFTQRAREAALMDDLYEMRKAIDSFYADKQRYPADLNELVPRYLRRIPADPTTKQVDWEQVPNDTQSSTDSLSSSPDPLSSADPTATPGIVDVKSKSKGKTLDGKPYTDL